VRAQGVTIKRPAHSHRGRQGARNRVDVCMTGGDEKNVPAPLYTSRLEQLLFELTSDPLKKIQIFLSKGPFAVGVRNDPP